MYTSAHASEFTGVLSRSYPALNELVSWLLNLIARAPTIATRFAFALRSVPLANIEIYQCYQA
jgi:hypothetical protein